MEHVSKQMMTGYCKTEVELLILLLYVCSPSKRQQPLDCIIICRVKSAKKCHPAFSESMSRQSMWDIIWVLP